MDTVESLESIMKEEAAAVPMESREWPDSPEAGQDNHGNQDNRDEGGN